LKRYIFVLLIPLFSYSELITLEELKTYPRSYAKDFYIWQFLQQKGTTLGEAEIAYQQVYRSKSKIDKAFKKLGGRIGQSSNKTDLSIHNIISLSSKKLAEIALEHQKRELVLKAMQSKEPVEKVLKDSPKLYLEIFLDLPVEKRRSSKFARELPAWYLKKLLDYESLFQKFVANVIAYRGFKSLKKSLLKLEASEKMSKKTLFYLAFHFIKNGKSKKEVMRFFELAEKKSYYQADKDRANFWLYLITKKRDYLAKVLDSWDINIYTIYAHEEFGQKIENIISKEKTGKWFHKELVPKNPFEWIKIKEEIKERQDLDEMAEEYRFEGRGEVFYYILERKNRFRQQSFPMLYERELLGVDPEIKALIYAIGRQESRFIPPLVSSAFALGVMQIMPFLIEDIAKEKGEKVTLFDMFRPEKSIEYALHHLKKLEKSFQNPLYMAYAYNGGSGYTRRMLRSGKFQKGEYEPFLSMETLTYYETRKYGKKVLANYIIYRKLLGKPITLHQFLNKWF
jgi:soluble lytic murein transglycosylase